MEQVLLDIIPDIDPATLDAFLEMADFSLISVITMLVINSLLFSLFAMIGGILLVAVIGRQGPPRPVAGPGGLPAGPDSRDPGLDGPGGTAPPPTI
jgi:hypothetical protein